MAAKVEWSRTSNGDWNADINGWGAIVRYEAEPIIGDPHWEWSLMKFKNPDDDADDRIVSLGGEEPTKAKAMRAAVAAAKEN